MVRSSDGAQLDPSVVGFERLDILGPVLRQAVLRVDPSGRRCKPAQVAGRRSNQAALLAEGPMEWAPQAHRRLGQSASGCPHFVNHASTKAAIVVFTYAPATELEPDAVILSAIAQGFITTLGSSAVESNDVFDAVVQRQWIKRGGTPEDMAGLVAYLASDESGFGTSQIIGFDTSLVHR